MGSSDLSPKLAIPEKRYYFTAIKILLGEQEMTTISLKIPDMVNQKISQVAEKRGINKSQLIRQALERMLESKDSISSSCLEAASGLAGSLNGPIDLSSDKKHMNGFGK